MIKYILNYKFTKARWPRFILILLSFFMVYLTNSFYFSHKFTNIKPLMQKQEVLGLLWPYGPYRSVVVNEKWEIWSCSTFPLRKHMLKSSAVNDITMLFEDYEAYEILFDEHGNVCTTVCVGEVNEMNTNIGVIKGDSVRDYLEAIK